MIKPRMLKYDSSLLNDEEKLVVEILVKIGEIIHNLWLKQFDEKQGYIAMFPESATKEEIIKASEDNKLILDSYTVVKRDTNNKFQIVPYSVEYSREIKEIIELLNKAGRITTDNNLKEYLLEIANSYAEGDFNKALEAYVKREDTKIAFLMGPIETYLDKTFGVKKAWQFNLRITVNDETENIRKMLELVKSRVLVKPFGSTAEALNNENIKISVSDVIMFSGRQAGSFTSSTNLPEDPELIRKYGTKIVFYRNSMNNKFDTLVRKYVDLITGIDIKGKEILLSDSYLYLIALHEIVEASIQYERVRERLQGYTDAIREFHAFLVGIKNAKYMTLNGYFSEEQNNMIMMTFILYGMDVLRRRDKDPSIMEYARGFAVLMNYALNKGIFEITNNGLLKINKELMGELTKLTAIVMEIYAVGSFEDVDKFFKTYDDFSFEKRIDFSKVE